MPPPLALSARLYAGDLWRTDGRRIGPMFFRLGGRGTANPLCGSDMAIILALVTLAVVVIAPVKMQRRLYSHRCSVYPAGRRWTCDDARRCRGTLQQTIHACIYLPAKLVCGAVASGLLYAHGSGTL